MVAADYGVPQLRRRIFFLATRTGVPISFPEPTHGEAGLFDVQPHVTVEEAIGDLPLMKGTETDVQEFILNFREQFKKLPPEDISFPRGLNGLTEYSDSVMMYKKGTPIHVRGAILYNHYLKQYDLVKKYPLIQEGEKLKFTYLKVPNHFKEDVISYPGRLPKEFNLDDYIDYETQFNKAFVEPVKVILDCLSWQVEKQNSIESFFG